MRQKHATFKIRGKPELWLITKKKYGDITRQEVSDTYCEKFGEWTVWAVDIENLTTIINEEEIKRLFEEVDDENKLHI